MDLVPRSSWYSKLLSGCRKCLMQESLSFGQANAQAQFSSLNSLLEIAEVQVVSRARDFAQLPVWAQLVIERSGPGLGQRLGVFHGDVEFQMIFVHAPEALSDVQLIAVRMAQAVQPGLVIESDRIHNECGVSVPMAD